MFWGDSASLVWVSGHATARFGLEQLLLDTACTLSDLWLPLDVQLNPPAIAIQAASSDSPAPSVKILNTKDTRKKGK